MSSTEHELDLLEHIARNSDSVHQRDLARVVGLSLGMTNAIVKRLVQRGWLTIRKVNNRNIRYAVSPAGIEQITRRSYQFLKRTIRNIADYKVAIEGFVRDLKAKGFTGLVLSGLSDLDFIVEHFCSQNGLAFLRDEASFAGAMDGKTGLYLLYSESYIPDDEEKARVPNIAFLQEVVSAGLRVAPRLPGKP